MKAEKNKGKAKYKGEMEQEKESLCKASKLRHRLAGQ
jgi:hypothetical protein